jgi:4-amino-4-deoxy-L-arabinose transferase-like glycosyltransferase
MGILGIFGFLFAVTGLGNQWVLLAVLGILFFTTWSKYKNIILQDYQVTIKICIRSIQYAPRWIPVFFFITFFFSFLLALAPPIEAFDGLLYHLTVPAWWLRDGSVQVVDLYPYWFPSLPEGMFVYPLSFDLDSTPQLIHFTFAILLISLIFGWTQELFGFRVAWWSAALFISMPSIPWISAWVYTDLILTFYVFVSLILLFKWIKDFSNISWLISAGIFCGFAVGIKYTIFPLPVIGCVLICWRLRNNLKMLAINLTMFVGFALLIGGVWYLRNLIWAGNPFYPFVFGGIYWDDFRANWYAPPGTGIGFDLFEWVLLPFVATLGFRDRTFFDSRIGPYFIILAPFFIYVVWKLYKTKSKYIEFISILLSFSFSILIFWFIGVTQTSTSMQVRWALPAILVLLPLFGKSILELPTFEIPSLRLRFIFSTIMALTTFAFLLDFALLVMVRNPMIAAIGVESRQAYTARFNPTYAQLLDVANSTPADAYIYLINEPRVYGINRLVVSDPNNDHVAHSFYLYTTNEEIISAWKQVGYTHVIVRMYVFDSEIENQHLTPRFDDLRQMLIEIDRTEDYILYEIPD